MTPHGVSAPSSHGGGPWVNPPPSGYEQHQPRGPPPMERDNWQRGPPAGPGRMSSGNRGGPGADRWERDRAMHGDDRRSYGYR